MKNKTVMPFQEQNISSYTIDNPSARVSDSDFVIKEQLYEQYKQSKKDGFKGTYEEYLSIRDFT